MEKEKEKVEFIWGYDSEAASAYGSDTESVATDATDESSLNSKRPSGAEPDPGPGRCGSELDKATCGKQTDRQSTFGEELDGKEVNEDVVPDASDDSEHLKTPRPGPIAPRHIKRSRSHRKTVTGVSPSRLNQETIYNESRSRSKTGNKSPTSASEGVSVDRDDECRGKASYFNL